MLILVNGITSSMFDYSSTILDTNNLPIKFKNYIESLPNGYHIKYSEGLDKLGEEFSVLEYSPIILPKSFLTSDAKIDKIISMDYYIRKE